MSTAPPTEPGPSPTPGHGPATAVLVAVLALHAVLAVRLFPSLGSIGDDRPVVMVDHAIHEYHGALGARFLREHGTTWGFDPFFMAGYPETPVWDSSSNPSILFQLLAGGGYRPWAYKVGLLACSLFAVAAVPLAAWAAGLDRAAVAGSAGLATLYFWAGMPASMWRSGLFAFLTSASGVVLLLGLAVRFDRRPTLGTWTALTGCAIGAFFCHVTAPIMACGGLVPAYATAARRHGPRWHVALLWAVGLTVAANLVWLVPLLRFRGIRSGSNPFLISDSAFYLCDYYLGLDFDGALPASCLIAGVAGLVAWAAGGRGTSALAFGGAAGLMLVLTGFGSLWGVTRALEPLRFRVALNLLLAVPAGSAVAWGTARLARRAGGGARGAVVAAAAWGAVAAASGMATPAGAARYARRLFLRYPLAVGLAPEMDELVGWLRRETDPSARVLFEDQLRLLETTAPECTHWTPLLPLLLRPEARQFLGGLYHSAFIAHRRMADFGDFQLGDRRIDRWSPTELRTYFHLYNVGWVVCWSPLSRFCFDRSDSARRVGTIARHATPGRIPRPDRELWEVVVRRAGVEVAERYFREAGTTYALYRIERPHSFVLHGRGRLVSADANRIELADVASDDGVVTLSLHWLDTWRADPPLPLQREPEPSDPVGFVRIRLPGPIPRLVLFNDYGRR